MPVAENRTNPVPQGNPVENLGAALARTKIRAEVLAAAGSAGAVQR